MWPVSNLQNIIFQNACVRILLNFCIDSFLIFQWVPDGSPAHTCAPVRIEGALQFVPKNTNPKEFKQLQQQVCKLQITSLIMCIIDQLTKKYCIID